jgi:SAM-dependent methyltransferase
LCDAYLATPKEQVFYPLELHQCQDCGFVQINTVIDPEVIYRDYLYVTTSSSGLNSHFANYADAVCSRLKLSPDRLVIDIGSNDGTLLSHFKALRHRVIGVEPSVKTAHAATAGGIETLPEFFDSELASTIVARYGHADIVTINNLFANIDDLHRFVGAVVNVLSDDGVLVIESSYLLDMIDNMVFDFIYHEHLSYFSIQPLLKFFKGFGIRLIDLQHVPTKGGSLRYYWAKDESKWPQSPDVDQFIYREEQAEIGMATFGEFAHRISVAKNQLIQYLTAGKFKTIAGYGASATSTTLITHFGLDRFLNYLVDDNQSKIGTYSPGYHIPVHSPAELWEDPPDVLVILAWRFRKEILDKLSELNTRIIVPLPHCDLVDHSA